MFENMKDLGKLFKQAKEMKSKMKDVQGELKKKKISAVAYNNLIKIVITGELDIEAIKIDPSLLAPDKADKLEKGLIAALNSAIKQAKDLAANKLSAISGDFKIPGL